MKTLISVAILTLLFLVGSKNTILGYSEEDYQREKKEFCSVYLDDEKVKNIIDQDLIKNITTRPGSLYGYCNRTTLIGLPDISSRLLTNEYGLGIERKYSYSQFCVSTSYLLKDLSANDIRRLMVLMSRPLMRSIGEHRIKQEERIPGGIPESADGILNWFFLLQGVKKSNDMNNFIDAFALLYMDLKYYPELDIKNRNISKYKSKEYKDFFKFLFLGDKNGALKILRSSVSKAEIVSPLTELCGVGFWDLINYFPENKEERK